MALNFTEEQQQVIDLRDRSLLVSAAAGSGKTAVLVQRILGRIMDPSQPVDIDRLLVMTFTRAAAQEMKERLAAALEEALYQDPENLHLQRQMTLVHAAQITTIDGFCSYLVRSYYHVIDLDPAFRVGEEGELRLLREDLVRDFLTEVYERENPEFLHFLACFSPRRNDEDVLALILMLYDRAMSSPDPRGWLGCALDGYQMEQKKDGEEASTSVKNQPFFSLLLQEVRRAFETARWVLVKAKEECQAPDGPAAYLEAVEADLFQLSSLEHLLSEEGIPALWEGVRTITFPALSRKKMTDVSPERKERAKELRDRAKKTLTELRDRLFCDSWENVEEAAKTAARPLRVLVELTLEFMDRYAKAKREKNLVDFGDLEHMALEILRKDAPSPGEPGTVARELQQRYEEVMVDEYQDSNLVQEYLTRYVSRQEDGKRNLFMVGDVKQSIYRFRQARPDLFMGKYRRFTYAQSQEQKIELHKNFRSRREVLGAINYLFYRLMGEDLGGVAYDEAAALYFGAEGYVPGTGEKEATELYLIDRSGGSDEEELSFDGSEDGPLGSEEALRREALVCALRIRRIIKEEQVYDRSAGGYRPSEYRDIAVLLRSRGRMAEIFSEVLASQEIPVYTSQRTGYFTATEVQTLLNYLRILDNPLQDIPLAGVLRSRMGDLTPEDLGVIRGEHPKGSLYHSLRAYLEVGQLSLFAADEKDVERRRKVLAFLSTWSELRERASYTSVSRLIRLVLNKTGYGEAMAALADGTQRSANLAMLEAKAAEYEKSSYRGLFNFVRYIEQLHQYEVDFGEANLSGAGEGAVQMMTIHMSKGLEFPIVLVAGLGRKFNKKDIRASVLTDPDLGIGADAILPERRLRVPTLQRRIIARKLELESLGEELRILYVALTRAREKLVLVGSVKNLGAQLSSLEREVWQDVALLPFSVRSSATSYLDWILAALMGHKATCQLQLKELGRFTFCGALNEEVAPFVVTRVDAQSLTRETVEAAFHQALTRERLSVWGTEEEREPALLKELRERFSFVYPRQGLDGLPVKVSVSDLKKRVILLEEEEEARGLLDERKKVPQERPYERKKEDEEAVGQEMEAEESEAYVPSFMREEEEKGNPGAARGTAYHRLMECLDYTDLCKAGSHKEKEAALCRQIDALVREEKLSQEQKEAISLPKILTFLSSDLGERMAAAAKDGRLIREQPFMTAREARSLREDWDSSAPVLVQGIIDAYFAEGEDLVLVDYKTDRVREPGGEKYLLNHYRVQLELYKEALERITGRRVKETYLYSYSLGRAVPVC